MLWIDNRYLNLTLVRSGTNVTIKAAHISAFYRKNDSDCTIVRLQGIADLMKVRETPEEISAKIEEVHPDYR